MRKEHQWGGRAWCCPLDVVEMARADSADGAQKRCKGADVKRATVKIQ
jgi:hypothetical protein